MTRQPSPVVPFFSNPLLQRFLQNVEHNELFSRVILFGREADRQDLERRFAEYYFEMRFLGYVRKHIHYEAMHLLNKSRAHHRKESLLLNTRIGGEEGEGKERVELLPDSSVSVEGRVVDDTFELTNLTDNPSLHEALQSLTPKQQTVMYLLYVKQCTEQEAALMLGVSQQAINKVKRSCLALLRRRLGAPPPKRMVGR